MNKIEYHLTALDRFACIGSDCPASCCSTKWDIAVGSDIYRQWQDISDAKERTRLLEAVVVQTVDDQEVLKMKSGGTGYCCLITEDRLCSLQQRHGETMMPSVCRTYPRMKSMTGTCALASLSLSCPEVAKGVLFSVNEPVFRKTSPKQIHLLTGDDQTRYALTELFDRVMAEPRYQLATRIFYFADVIVKLARLSRQKQLNATSFNQIIANSKNDLYQIGVDIKQRRLRPVSTVAGSFWHTLVHIARSKELLTEMETSSPLLVDLSEEPANRAQQYASAHSEIQRLRNASQGHWRAYDVHFTRYLHTTLMYNGFPWNPSVNNYVASFMRAMVPFALARLTLWLRAEKQGKLQDQDIIDITYQIERAITHSQQVLEILDRNPNLLELDQYHATFLEL
jgi:Fe-S-cluster containining protein